MKRVAVIEAERVIRIPHHSRLVVQLAVCSQLAHAGVDAGAGAGMRVVDVYGVVVVRVCGRCWGRGGGEWGWLVLPGAGAVVAVVSVTGGLACEGGDEGVGVYYVAEFAGERDEVGRVFSAVAF